MIALAVFVVAIGAHLAVVRLLKPQRFVAYSLLHGIVFALAYLAIDQQAQLSTRLPTAYFFYTSWALFVVFVINLRNSISLQLIRELKAGDGTLASQELAVFVSPSGLLNSRLEILQANAFLVSDAADRFYVTKKGASLATAVGLLRRVLRLQTGG